MLRKLCQTTSNSALFQLSRLQNVKCVVTTNVEGTLVSSTTFCRSIQRSCQSVPIVPYEYIKELSKHPEKLLIDVREPEELQQTGRIPTSINIPLGSLNAALQPSGDPSDFSKKYYRPKPIDQTEMIFSCQSGKRSTQATEVALALGYKNIKNYVGSWTDWAEHEGLNK